MLYRGLLSQFDFDVTKLTQDGKCFVYREQRNKELKINYNLEKKKINISKSKIGQDCHANRHSRKCLTFSHSQPYS
jgi:hypothetical protein